MSEKIKVLFVTDTFGYGGAEKQLAFVAEGLSKRGHKVGICNLNQGIRNEGSRTVSEGVEMFINERFYTNSLIAKCHFIALILKISRRYKPDVIVGFKELANFCSVLGGKLARVSSVISERADPYRTYANAGLNTRITLWIINHATGGVFQTEQASSFYCEKLRKNCAVIPNPVFINDAIPSIEYSKLPKTVVSLGRIDNKQKRLDVMIDAFALFHAKHPDYHLKIYGNGPDIEFVKAWISKKGLNNYVHLMGVSANSIGDMSKEGCFLITSDYEGISNSLLEAMACGLPVVSTDHTPGGARFLIEDGVNGLLAPMGDATAICQALCHYAGDHTLAEKCGKNAQKVLERFSPNKILDLWESYLLKLIKQSHVKHEIVNSYSNL